MRKPGLARPGARATIGMGSVSLGGSPVDMASAAGPPPPRSPCHPMPQVFAVTKQRQEGH
jgi:hypothetical protein